MHTFAFCGMHSWAHRFMALRADHMQQAVAFLHVLQDLHITPSVSVAGMLLDLGLKQADILCLHEPGFGNDFPACAALLICMHKSAVNSAL